MARRSSKIRRNAKGRPGATKASASAAKADALERERIRRMSALERALLALDLGDRFSLFAKPRP